MMTSDGKVGLYEELQQQPGSERLYRRVSQSRFPLPDACEPRRVLGALEKLSPAAEAGEEVKESHVALASLTPFERGYVLGLLGGMRSSR